MSTTTSNFGLFKYDTTADAQTAFSINTALNNNWDALDTNCVRRLSTSAATGSSTQPVYVDGTGKIQACNAYSTIPSGLTATTSLSENGYIKFSSFGTKCQDISKKSKNFKYSLSKNYVNNISFESQKKNLMSFLPIKLKLAV